MKLLDLTLDEGAANVALDEALLEQAERGELDDEVLRLWESPVPMVVVGRSSRVNDEVHVNACESRGIPIVRRCSGGASIVAGPGCLMYAVVLSYDKRPAMRMIEQAHRFVLEKLAAAIEPVVANVSASGTSDLTVGDHKFSGNSLRCKRTHLLYHGTLLYDFSLELIDACLKMPPRRPDYRGARGHLQFVKNIAADPEALKQAIINGWQVDGALSAWPSDLTDTLMQEKYSRRNWNFRF